MHTRRLRLFEKNVAFHPFALRRARALHHAQHPAHEGPAADVVEAGFGEHPIRWIRCLWKRFDRSRSLGLAAEMAFWLFLSLLPLAAVAGLITARVAVGNWSMTGPLLQSLPVATRELVGKELAQVAAWNGGQVGVWAGFIFIWLASSGIHSIFDGIELETDTLTPRPWWKKRLLAIASCVALSLGGVLVAMLGVGLGWLWRFVGSVGWLKALQLESSVGGQIVRFAIGAAVSFGLVYGLYWIALRPKPPRAMPIAPGALVAIVLQTVIGFGYGFYIKKAGDGDAYQAGLASIGVTMMALYLFCVVLLSGIKVNQLLGERRVALAEARDR